MAGEDLGYRLNRADISGENKKKVLRSSLWAASTDRPDHWPFVASSVVPIYSTKNELQRQRNTNKSLYIAD